MNQEFLSAIQSSPESQQAIGAAVQELLQDEDVTLEAIEQIINMLEFVMQDPSSYGEFRQTAIDSGMFDPEDMPEQFDAAALSTILLVMKIARQQMTENGPGFARGGLNRIARLGRRGDSELAHINPFERRVLKAYGGSGGINPATGLREYGLGSSLKKAFKKVAPILPVVLSIVAPGIGTAIGSALGASGIGASMLGSALIGGAGSALSGGNVLQGALLGGMTGGLGSSVGGFANNALGLGLGQAGQAVLGSGLVGGLAGAATGQGFGKGALQGAGGAFLGGQLAGAGTGLSTAGRTFGNMSAAGYKPKEAFVGGALSGLAAGMMQGQQNPAQGIKTPSELAVDGLKSPGIYSGVPEAGYGTTNYLMGDQGFMGSEGGFNVDYSLTGPGPGAQVAPAGFGAQDMGSGFSQQAAASIAPSAPAAPSGGFDFNMGTAAKGLMIASALQGAPQQAQEAVAALPPEQQEYFNRPSIAWDWNKMMQDASAQGQSLAEYMSGNWNSISTNYGRPVVAKARGGALSRMAYLAAGGGTGRSDSIEARLSDGEYVMDAETVALLGDGSTNAGARRLDEMRAKIREHKGKSMARGKFSANAKSPLAYLKGA